MEEMSKKTKRLEKENLNLTRKQEATNKNIFQMAEERSQSQQALDRLTRENEKLKKLCRAMQTGSYSGGAAGAGGASALGGAGGAAGAGGFRPAGGVGSVGADPLEMLEGDTESEYEDEEYDEDEEEEEQEYDDEDTEEEGLDVQPRTYGPPPPPPPQENGKMRQQQQQQQVNGTAAAVNGGRH